MEFVAPKHFFFSFSFGFTLKIKITSFLVIWNIAKNTTVSSVHSQPPVLWQGADFLSLAWGPGLAMGSSRSTAVPTSPLLPDWQWTQHVLGGGVKGDFFLGQKRMTSHRTKRASLCHREMSWMEVFVVVTRRTWEPSISLLSLGKLNTPQLSL